MLGLGEGLEPGELVLLHLEQGDLLLRQPAVREPLLGLGSLLQKAEITSARV